MSPLPTILHPAVGPFTLVRSDGTIYGPYETLHHLATLISGTVLYRLGTVHYRTVWTLDPDGRPKRQDFLVSEFILHNRDGLVVDPAPLRHLCRSLRDRQRMAGKAIGHFRCGPMPGTGKGTIQPEARLRDGWKERRTAVQDADHPVRLRASRIGKEAYGDWPDYDVPRRIERSWKRHRRTQYKAR